MRSWDCERLAYCAMFVVGVGTVIGIPAWMAVTGRRSEPFVSMQCVQWRTEHYNAWRCHCTTWNAATKTSDEACCWTEDATRQVCASKAPHRCTGNIYWPSACVRLEETPQ